MRAWLVAAAAIPSELRLSRAGRGVEGWYDPDGRSDEAEMRKYRGFCRQGDWKWAGDSAGEVGRRLMELRRYADAAVTTPEVEWTPLFHTRCKRYVRGDRWGIR